MEDDKEKPDNRIAPQSPRGEEQIPAASSRKTKLLAAGIAACALVIALVACVCLLQPGSNGAQAPAESGQVSAASGEPAQSGDASQADASVENQAAEKSDTKSDTKSAEKKASSKKAKSANSSKKSSDTAKSSDSASNSPEKASKSSSGKKSSSKGSGKSKAADEGYISVTFNIDGSRAGSQDTASMSTLTLKLEDGATVYDALVASGVSISGDSTYVSGINGLAERQCGALSGWMYHVNGEEPQVSCSKYVLKDGDSVQWLYTCDMGNDL